MSITKRGASLFLFLITHTLFDSPSSFSYLSWDTLILAPWHHDIAKLHEKLITVRHLLKKAITLCISCTRKVHTSLFVQSLAPTLYIHYIIVSLWVMAYLQIGYVTSSIPDWQPMSHLYDMWLFIDTCLQFMMACCCGFYQIEYDCHVLLVDDARSIIHLILVNWSCCHVILISGEKAFLRSALLAILFS